MKKLKSILIINFIIIIIYSGLIPFLILQLFEIGPIFGAYIFMVFAIPIHAIIIFIISLMYFSEKNFELGKIYLLCSLVVFVVGFSSCWGSIYLYG